MALPDQLLSARMNDATRCILIDNHLAAFEGATSEILGIPLNTDIAAAGFLFDLLGLTRINLQDLAGDPAAAGDLARNATLLKWHDSVAVRELLTSRKRIYVAKTIRQPLLLISGVVDDNELFSSLEASSYYFIRAHIRYFGSHGFFLMGWSGPAGFAMDWNIMHRRGDPSLEMSVNLDAAAQAVAPVASGIVGSLWAQGVVRTDVTPGTLTLQWGCFPVGNIELMIHGALHLEKM